MALSNPILNFLSIDPGDVHNGTVYWEIEWSNSQPSLIRHWTRDLKRDTLLRLVEDSPLDALVVETYVLYPEMAREQGYSDFPTPKLIGVLEYIAEIRGIPFFLQGAFVKKKARRIGEKIGFPGKERMIGTARNRYRGWDFDGPSQHERDGTGHGLYWAFRHQASTLCRKENQTTIVIGDR